MFPLKTQNRAKCHEKKDIPHNFLSPNCFLSLDFNNNLTIMETNSHDKDPTNSYTKENTDKRQNSINMTNGNRKK